MGEDELMSRLSVEYAVKELDDFLSAIRKSGSVTTSRVVDNLLDIRNHLVPIIRPTRN